MKFQVGQAFFAEEPALSKKMFFFGVFLNNKQWLAFFYCKVDIVYSQNTIYRYETRCLFNID